MSLASHSSLILYLLLLTIWSVLVHDIVCGLISWCGSIPNQVLALIASQLVMKVLIRGLDQLWLREDELWLPFD